MAKLKISSDTSDVKKSILNLGKDLRDLSGTKVSIFSSKDKKFINTELNKALSGMKLQLVENKKELSKLLKEQDKLKKGSKEELDNRKKILETYKDQSRLSKQIGQTQQQQQSLGQGGGLSGLLGKGLKFLGGAALGVAGLGLTRSIQSVNQVRGGARDRVRLAGLGVESTQIGGTEELANAGLTEQDFIRRQTRAVSRLGRSGGSRESVLQQARFERSFGLEEGTLTNISGSLRAQFGGRGADQAQQKLQATILASGIEDALGPYLESATELLSDINKNGMTNTDEITRIFAQLVKDGQRTPEQIAGAFQSINQAVKGSTGEANAFFQTAFAREGIGGGTIGGTRLALSSGGIFGLSESELKDRGYNPELIRNIKGAGLTSGAGTRTGAILDQFKKSAGLNVGQNVGDVTDLNTMVGLSQLANSTLGTSGLQGFDALKMMEKVQSKQLSQKEFETRLQEMKDKKNPQLDRLNKINQTLGGILDVAGNINTNLKESLGKAGAAGAVMSLEADNAIIQGATTISKSLGGDPKNLSKSAEESRNIRKGVTGGGFADKIFDFFSGDAEATSIKQAEEDFKNKKGNLPYMKFKGKSSSDSTKTSDPIEDISKGVEKGMSKALSAQKRQDVQNNNNVNIKIQNSDGKISNKTHR